MKYLIISRISSDRQVDEYQENMCLDYIRAHDKTDFEHKTYRDEMSAYRRKMVNRPGIGLALKEMVPGDIMVAVSVDRLCRRARDMYLLAEIIQERRCGLLVIQQDITDPLMLAVFAGLAEKESKLISWRVKQRFSGKKSRSERLGGNVPYGYSLDMVNLIPIKNKRDEGWTMKPGKLIENPEEQKILAAMLELVADHTLSFTMIAKALNDRGYKTRQGTEWYGCLVYRILGRLKNNRKSDLPQRPSKMDLFPGR